MSRRDPSASPNTAARVDPRRLLAMVMMAVGLTLVGSIVSAIVTGVQRYRNWPKVDARILEYATATAHGGDEGRVVHFRRYVYRVGDRAVLARGPDLRQGIGLFEVTRPPAGTDVRLAYDPQEPSHATTLRDAFTPPSMVTRLGMGVLLLVVGGFAWRVFGRLPPRTS
jgi:hypothetical protein